MSHRCEAATAATLLALALIGGFGMPVQAASPRRHVSPPPESYLQYRVYTVGQLIDQVQNNAVVRQRFARHFQIPEDRVVSYMRANLVESYIPQTRRYTVYCVSRSGKFFPVKQMFHKGTKVFALRNGQPVLKWLCGNPLSRFLPTVMTKTFVKKPKTKVSPYTEVLVTPAEQQDVIVPNEATAPEVLAAVPFSLGSAPASIFSSLGGSTFNALYLLPAALLFSNLGGGGGGGGVTPHIPPAPSVPESGGAVYLLAALPLLGVVVLRRRKADGTNRSSRPS